MIPSGREARFIYEFGVQRGVSAPDAHRPNHPEECPKCGKLARHWFYAGNALYVECESCGYFGTKSKYAIRV